MPDNFYSDNEVVPAVNNAVIAVTRWERAQGKLKETPHRLKALAKALVENAQNAIKDPLTGEEAFSPAELVVGFQIAAGVILINSDILPEDSPARRTFISRASTSKSKRPRLTLVEDLTPMREPQTTPLDAVSKVELPKVDNPQPLPEVA